MSEQFGGLLCRSATGLTTFLILNVEQALNEEYTTCMTTLNVKVIFDALLRGRRVRRLREVGLT